MEFGFTFKDVFRSVRLGASPKKIWIGLVGIFITTVFYAIFSYIGFLLSGWSLKNIWQEFRFIPWPFYHVTLTWYGWIFWIIGALISLFFYFVTSTAISKVTYEQLKGDEFYESKEAWKFAYKNWKGTFLSPIYLGIFIGILLLVGLVFGLIGRIPYVGQIIIALFSIPLISGAFFIVYLSIVLMVVMVIAPAVVSTTESDTFDTLFEGFSVLNDQTWRFFLWEFILLVSAFLATFVFALLLLYTLKLTHWALGVWQGPRNWLSIMWEQGKWYLYLPFAPTFLLKWFPGIISPMNFPSLALFSVYPGITTPFAGFILGIVFYLVVFAILGYALSVFQAGQTIIYITLVKLKDDKNLLEKKEEVFEAEMKEGEKEEKEDKKKTVKKKRIIKKK